MNPTYREVFENEQSRAVAKLTLLEPGATEFNCCIDAIRMLDYLIHAAGANATERPTPKEEPRKVEEPTPDERAADPENIDESSEAVRVHVPETPAPVPAETTPEPAPAGPKAITPAPKPAVELTRDYMVTQLSYYRGLGVNVPEIMGQFGYDRLSSIPAGDYEKVLNAVIDAAAEGNGGNDAS